MKEFKPRGFPIGGWTAVVARNFARVNRDRGALHSARTARERERERERTITAIALRPRWPRRAAGAGDFGPIYL